MMGISPLATASSNKRSNGRALSRSPLIRDMRKLLAIPRSFTPILEFHPVHSSPVREETTESPYQVEPETWWNSNKPRPRPVSAHSITFSCSTADIAAAAPLSELSLDQTLLLETRSSNSSVDPSLYIEQHTETFLSSCVSFTTLGHSLPPASDESKQTHQSTDVAAAVALSKLSPLDQTLLLQAPSTTSPVDPALYIEQHEDAFLRNCLSFTTLGLSFQPASDESKQPHQPECPENLTIAAPVVDYDRQCKVVSSEVAAHLSQRRVESLSRTPAVSPLDAVVASYAARSSSISIPSEVDCTKALSLLEVKDKLALLPSTVFSSDSSSSALCDVSFESESKQRECSEVDDVSVLFRGGVERLVSIIKPECRLEQSISFSAVVEEDPSGSVGDDALAAVFDLSANPDKLLQNGSTTESTDSSIESESDTIVEAQDEEHNVLSTLPPFVVNAAESFDSIIEAAPDMANWNDIWTDAFSDPALCDLAVHIPSTTATCSINGDERKEIGSSTKIEMDIESECDDYSYETESDMDIETETDDESVADQDMGDDDNARFPLALRNTFVAHILCNAPELTMDSHRPKYALVSRYQDSFPVIEEENQIMFANDFVAHIVLNSSQLSWNSHRRRYAVVGRYEQTVDTIDEEDEEAEAVQYGLAAAPSGGSLPTVPSDQFEYEKYVTISSEPSSSSMVMEQEEALVTYERPMSRCCMRRSDGNYSDDDDA
ncbi:hypothetical protein QFC19_008686 [Naganishia cerealis]|uniref:Uncharacterized protein n=1 Tax=Naganishia cerealis TaxID=610337 RepID=A0ACC2V0H2_9TREE|nr:hypothetical protein QFC19_008686 [Naganishia cerealis]